MAGSRRVIGFINVGHMLDHLFMLIFPTAVLGMQAEFHESYSALITLSVGGFIAFGAGSLPAGWLGDRWSRRNMMAVFFLGVAATSILTGCAGSLWQLAAGLAAIGLFAAIYHPVGTAMLVSHAERVGREIGVNGVWGNVGVAAAALVTGAVTQWLGWRWAFILPGLASLAIGIAYIALVPDEGNRAGMRRATAHAANFPRDIIIRAFVVLAAVTLAGGIVFNATTVALPKLLAERLPQLAGSTFAVGALVAGIYLIGALAQLVTGRVIDRYPLKVGFFAIVLFQAPLLLATAAAPGWLVVLAATAMIFAIFGQVTFNDSMVARYASDEWRSRVYAVRYVLSFGVSAAAVPLVAYMHARGGFAGLLHVLAGCAAVVLIGAACFPYRRDELAPPAPAQPVPALAPGE